MFRFFKKSNSKKTAKERLMAVVSSDRANVSAEFILKMTADIIQAAVKYIEPDYDNISVHIERKGASSYLLASMPVNFFKAI